MNTFIPQGRKLPSEVYKRCGKGRHWTNKCRSKTDKSGNLLSPLPGNGSRGPQTWGPNNYKSTTIPSEQWPTTSRNEFKSSLRIPHLTPVSQLYAATKQSAAADLTITQPYTLSPNRGVYKLAIRVCGPLPKGHVGLLLGQNNSAIQGLMVIPGIIDPDVTNKILIMVQVSQCIRLEAGECIAQLLLLPFFRFYLKRYLDREGLVTQKKLFFGKL